MGYVTSINPSVSINVPVNPPNIHESGEWKGNIDAWSPTVANLVSNKFATTMQTAEDMLELLVGTNGYLSQLNSVIDSLALPGVSYAPVNIPDLGGTIPSPPVLQGSIDLVFPSFTSLPPSLSAIPTVDLSSLTPSTLPISITSDVNWIANLHDETLFTSILTRLINDLQSGSTGLDPLVEQAIFDRAIARQNIEFDKTQQEIEQYFASRGFDLPTGAMASRLQEHSNERARNVLDINAKVMIDQADLAQKNSQFVITASRELESVLRDFTFKQNNINLDYSKAVASNAIALYAENVKAYIAAAEANKIYVTVQVENLKAIVEYNKGLIAAYTAEVDAYNALISGKSSKNKAITDVYASETSGYESEVRAMSEYQNSKVAEYGLRIKNAESDLAAQIAELEAITKGYTSEYGLREKVAEAMANIAMQTMSSAYGAVNASAGMSYNGSESTSESWGHSESRSDSYSHSESISSAASVSAAISNSLTEEHTYKEK